MHQMKNFPDNFKPVSKTDWITKVEKDLKGKPYSAFQTDMGGIPMEAFFYPDDERMPYPSLERSPGWEIGQDFEVENNPASVNRELLAALAMGINAPRFLLHANPEKQELSGWLEGVRLEMVSLHFVFLNEDPNPAGLVDHLFQVAAAKNVPDSGLHFSTNWLRPNAVAENRLRDMINSMEGINGRVLTVDGQACFSEKHTSVELAKLIQQGNAWISQMGDHSLAPSMVQQYIQFSVSIGKNYFLQIAKLRALRLLWANVLKGWGIERPLPVCIETHLDPGEWTEDVNQARIAATTQAMSAIIGGSDRLFVTPAPENEAEKKDFSNRIARNVQHILQMESGFDRVADPAAGSYFVEELTSQLATEAWKEFSAHP